MFPCHPTSRKVDASDVGSFFPFRTFAEINVATLQKVVEPADARLSGIALRR
jgi:hypothetical protein